MILRWLREPNNTESGANVPSSSYLSPAEVMERSALLNKVDTKSIWTVDLLWLLENVLSRDEKEPNDNNQKQSQPNHRNTTYLFCSEVLGVNSSHGTTGYYEKAFSADSHRVMKLSEEMVSLNLPLLCPYHLEFDYLLEMISYDHCIAVVLVDNYVLKKLDEDDENDNKDDTYLGHYLIVCGISRDPDHLVSAYSHQEIEDFNADDSGDLFCLVVVNPGIMQRVVFLSPKRLELAWRADGTDCDCIFIAKHDR